MVMGKMKKQTYENAVTKLEEIVLKLEDGKLPLDDALKLFEEGTKLSQFCNECLNKAEQKIITLSELDLSESEEVGE